MTAFEPGEGWREVASLGHDLADVDSDGIHCRLNGVDRYWVREEPVPPLPIEPNTVIRAWVQGADEPRSYVLSAFGIWFRIGKTSTLRDVSKVERYEVLARPGVGSLRSWKENDVRRETATAVLERFSEEIVAHPHDMDRVFTTIMRDFGVES